jgi:hypothetical protein
MRIKGHLGNRHGRRLIGLRNHQIGYMNQGSCPQRVGAWARADFRAFDSMGGPCPKLCHHDPHQELKELRYRVWVNSVLKPLCAVFECLFVRFFDQVPGGKAIESFGIESKLAPSF